MIMIAPERRLCAADLPALVGVRKSGLVDFVACSTKMLA